MSLTTVYHAPKNLAEALELLRRLGPDAKVVSGGQSVLPLINLRMMRPEILVDISPLASELSYIRRVGDHLVIGAMTCHRDVEHSDLVAETVPLLREAVHQIGHPQIRNRGTIGGSVAHADPSAEYPVSLVCLGAEFKLQSTGGERWVPADEFFLAPLITALLPEELLTEVRVPVPPSGAGAAFREFSQRVGDFALVCAAALVRVEAGVVASARIAVGGANPVPARALQAEAALVGQPAQAEAIQAAATAAMAEADPEGDSNASADYKRHLVQVLVRDALRAAMGL